MKNQERLPIHVRLSDNLVHYTDPNDVAEIIQAALKRAKDEDLTAPYISYYYEHDYYNGVNLFIHITAYRKETDEEYQLRTQLEQRRQEKTLEQERKEYERLRKEFEGK